MQTHLDLIFEQLDTLLDLLQRQSRSLHAWADKHLSDWHQEDYHSLVDQVEHVSGEMSSLWEVPPSSALRTRLFDIREFASLLLNTQTLAPTQEEQLRLIYLTSADLLDIVDEIAVQ